MSEDTKHYILKDKLKTWVGRDFNGVTINPKIGNQNALSKKACVHHSLCPIMETLQKKIDPYNNYSVDVRWLIRNFPPPTTAEKLVKALREKYDGEIKASNIDISPFKVTRSTCYDISAGAVSSEAYKKMEKIVEHLKFDSPVMGSFTPDEDYNNPGRDGIYVSKRNPKVVTCPECGRMLTLRHAVCVVGSGVGMVNNVATPCFQYLESDDPVKYSGDEDGICYMTVYSMDSITIIE